MARRRRSTEEGGGSARETAVPVPSPFVMAQRADRTLLRALLAGYFICLALGAVLLRHTANPSGNPMPLDRAVFASANALTLTGFELAPTAVRDFQPPGQVVVFGLTVAGVLFCLTAGASLVSSLLGLGLTRRRIVGFAIGAGVVATMAGTGFLMLQNQAVFPTVFSAAAAFGNSGSTIQGPWNVMDGRLHLVLLPLAALGGLGMPLLMDLWGMLAGTGRLSDYSSRVLRIWAVLYLVSAAVLLVLQWDGAESTRQCVASSSMLAMDSRSLGLVTSPMPWTRAAQWFVMLLMLIGGAPAGTAGGMRLTTLAVLAGGTRKLLRAQTPPREMGFALCWAGAFLAMAFAAALAILTLQPQLPGDRAVFLAVSAVGNVGLSHDPVSMTGLSLYVGAAAMLAGRLAPVAITWWMVRKGGNWETPLC